MSAHWEGGNGGKGSKQRPKSISDKEYEERWDAIFGKDKPDVVEATEEKEEKEPIKIKATIPDLRIKGSVV